MFSQRQFKNQVSATISFLFILLFTYAAVSKLLDFQNFRLQLGQSTLITSIAGLVSWTIPIVELGISLLLAIPKYRLTGMYAAYGLMIMFAGYIIAVTRFSSDTPCSCGGVLQKMTWDQHLIFNIVFILLAVAGVLSSVKKEIPVNPSIK